MKPYPRANQSQGDAVTLSVDLYNRMVEDIERLDRLSVAPPLTMISGPGGATIGMSQSPASVVVAIVGAETGGGRYKGSILFGNSTGNTSNNFQLQSSSSQSATDGPQPANNTYPNNALVINVREQFVGGSHKLYAGQGILYYAVGRIMGQTQEATPRTIVYINDWPLVPVIAKITGLIGAPSMAGVYYGQIVQSMFSDGSNFGYSFALSTLGAGFLPSSNDCWIANVWEQTNAPGNGTHVLANGSYVWGFMTGFPAGAHDSPGTQTWYMVHTWFPPLSPTLTSPIQNVATTQTAGTTYGTNEQTMLNALKSDVTNLHASLLDWYTKMKTSGYTG